MNKSLKQYAAVFGAVALVMAPGVLLLNVLGVHGATLDVCVLLSLLVTLPVLYKAGTYLQRNLNQEKGQTPPGASSP